jgi:hypothetical protein
MAGVITDTARQLSRAQDEQVAQVVALIDAMQDRGDADAMIAPLRRRLQRLRPPRPPRLGRLLFAPLDPVIVPPKIWRPGDATLPRSALASFKALVQAGLGAGAEALERHVADYKGAMTELALVVGSAIWPPASAALAAAADRPPPPEWRIAGLPAESFAPLCTATARVMQNAALIESWVARDLHNEAISAKAIEALVGGAAGAGDSALLAAVLMARLPRSTPDILRVLQTAWPTAAFGASPAASLALNAAVAHLRMTAEISVAGAPLSELSRLAEQAALLLAALLKEAGPRRRGELEAIARTLEGQCRERLMDSLAADVIAPACALGQDEEAAITVPQIEAAARDLRRLQIAAKRLGGASYDGMLRRAAEAIRDLPMDARLTLVDRVRLAEILAGAETALRLFRIG